MKLLNHFAFRGLEVEYKFGPAGRLGKFRPHLMDRFTSPCDPTRLYAVIISLILANVLVAVHYLSPATLPNIRSLVLGRSPTSRSSPFSLGRALYSYSQYERLAYYDLQRKKRSFSKLSRPDKRIGTQIGYPNKLSNFASTIKANAIVTRGIAALAAAEFGAGADGGHSGQPNLGRVTEALKHFVRDWSEEAREEREKIYQLILEVLRRDRVSQATQNVLVPGAGLGRLAYEISQLGYDTTYVEISYYMSLAFRFLLSRTTTQYTNQHTIHPYASWFSHSRSSSHLLRGISFPDILPTECDTLHLSESDFLSLTIPPSGAYTHIVTLFFIDTALNIVRYLEQIHSLLAPNGVWINLGPLLWTGNSDPAMELSLEEVLDLANVVGFDVAERRSIDSEYTANRGSMMRWVYETEFWVARKRSVSLE